MTTLVRRAEAGVLKLHIPKAEAVTPRQIRITPRQIRITPTTHAGTNGSNGKHGLATVESTTETARAIA